MWQHCHPFKRQRTALYQLLVWHRPLCTVNFEGSPMTGVGGASTVAQQCTMKDSEGRWENVWGRLAGGNSAGGSLGSSNLPFPPPQLSSLPHRPVSELCCLCHAVSQAVERQPARKCQLDKVSFSTFQALPPLRKSKYTKKISPLFKLQQMEARMEGWIPSLRARCAIFSCPWL